MSDLRTFSNALAATAGRRRSSLATGHRPLTTVRAFTLIELLIVLAIIGLVAALGVPLFGVLTGSRSVEAGRNVVAATLGQARTVAVNEGKYAGVMFYVDPATERTAMSIVVVTDPASSLEDADPYDKYKSWVPGETYFSGKTDNGQTTPRRGDRVIGFAADANSTYRGELYDPAGTPQPPLASEYLKLFGNYRPTVRSYRCITSHDAPDQSTRGIRPPQNGPFPLKTPPAAKKYEPNAPYNNPPASSDYDKDMESLGTRGPFSNDFWGLENQTEVTRYSTGEQTLLPRGVGVQLLVQPISVSGGTERYLRTGVIMFDPQGRLVLRNFSLDQTDALGEYLQLNARARDIVSGVGLAIYDTPNFKSQSGFSDTDVAYQNLYPITAPTNPALSEPVAVGNEALEEQWLDANGTPLVINRFTGSISEAD